MATRILLIEGQFTFHLDSGNEWKQKIFLNSISILRRTQKPSDNRNRYNLFLFLHLGG